MKLKIISDGTNKGTKLIDEDTGEVVHLIQKLSLEIDANEPCTKVTIELLDVPVEITSKAKVDLFELGKENNYTIPTYSKSFEKEIKIVSESPRKVGLVPFTKIYDVETNEQVGAIQKIEWEATPSQIKTKVKKIKFDNKDW